MLHVAELFVPPQLRFYFYSSLHRMLAVHVNHDTHVMAGHQVQIVTLLLLTNDGWIAGQPVSEWFGICYYCAAAAHLDCTLRIKVGRHSAPQQPHAATV